MLDMIITGEYPYTFNKKTSRLNLQISMSGRFVPGNFMVFECLRIVDEETYEKVFNDVWVKEYTVALFKQQWGANLTKYGNYTLPGGLVVNGEKIYNDATLEVARLEEKLRDEYEEPTPFLVG
jgi:8-oxo-dGTP pyrophosphatase MutT (NUDIX family)